MKLKINHLPRVPVETDWRPKQYIKGEQVDGIVKPGEYYIYWIGYKTRIGNFAYEY
jgi:hypothetical protein